MSLSAKIRPTRRPRRKAVRERTLHEKSCYPVDTKKPLLILSAFAKCRCRPWLVNIHPGEHRHSFRFLRQLELFPSRLFFLSSMQHNGHKGCGLTPGVGFHIAKPQPDVAKNNPKQTHSRPFEACPPFRSSSSCIRSLGVGYWPSK
jgi:hypothetical protein